MASKSWNKVKMGIIYWIARRLPACDEILPLISRQMDQPLPWRQRINVFMHNSICELCKRYANQLLTLRQAARKYAADPDAALADTPLSFEARERMKRFLS
jgi:hypothetical protein